MRIADIIARQNLFSPGETAILKEDVRQYLAASQASCSDLLANRASGKISPALLHSYLRRREREENTCQILQYLLMYSDCLDNAVPCLPEEEAARQLQAFVRFQVEILKREDVRLAILTELRQLGIVRSDFAWIHERRIDDVYRELAGAIDASSGDCGQAVLQLCRVLERLSLFWFDICREDFRKVRESDIYAYKLSLLVQRGIAALPPQSRPLPPGFALRPVKTSYLEMTEPPAGPPLPPPAGCEFRPWPAPEACGYRELFLAVGGDWGWSGRLLLPEAGLRRVLAAAGHEVFRLHCGPAVAGFAELERAAAPPHAEGARPGEEVEIQYIGLLPAFIGKGLGRFLLDQAIRAAWKPETRRLWLHTCERDHPRAMAAYLKAGFRLSVVREELQPYPQEPGGARPAS